MKYISDVVFFLAEYNLSFHDHSSKISDSERLISSALGLYNRVLALYLQKYWVFFIHSHHKMPLKFYLHNVGTHNIKPIHCVFNKIFKNGKVRLPFYLVNQHLMLQQLE